MKKRHRNRRANSDAIIPAGPEGYIVCPHIPCGGFVRLEVCRLKHFFWSEPPLELDKGSSFAEAFCRKCTIWKRYVSSEMRNPCSKSERKQFLAVPPKFDRVRHFVGPMVKFRCVNKKYVRRRRKEVID